ncbi:MAG: rubrerythrin [Planctomycetota bacterium]|nr:MAG: rubrerythrin [Planctomycetota bacterium]
MSSNDQILELLRKAYMMEVETVTNYLANSIHLDGVQAEEIKRALADDVSEELGHARQLAERITQLGGRIPGSLELDRSQELLQPPIESINVEAVVDGVIEAESEAIAHYRLIVETTDDFDFVTQNLAIKLMADEEQHCRQFEGFRAGFQGEALVAS